eukprot:6074589-Amphidinium_carterae.1
MYSPWPISVLPLGDSIVHIPRMAKLWSVVALAGLARCDGVFAGLSSGAEHNASLKTVMAANGSFTAPSMVEDVSQEDGRVGQSVGDALKHIAHHWHDHASSVLEVSAGAASSVVLAAPQTVHDLLLASAHHWDRVGQPAHGSQQNDHS